MTEKEGAVYIPLRLSDEVNKFRQVLRNSKIPTLSKKQIASKKEAEEWILVIDVEELIILGMEELENIVKIVKMIIITF